MVALGGTNRLLIVGLLVGLFTVSVVAYHLRPFLFDLARSNMGRRDWMAPPPAPIQRPKSQNQIGFVPLEELESLLEFSEADEPTNYDELPDVSLARTGEQPVIRSWSREIVGDELDIIDLQIAKYIPGFRDEYFLAEAKDTWMKRFHRQGEVSSEVGIAEFPLEGVTQDRVVDLSAALIESVVSSKLCILKIRFRADLVSSVSGVVSPFQEVWTYVCQPEHDRRFVVRDVQVMG